MVCGWVHEQAGGDPGLTDGTVIKRKVRLTDQLYTAILISVDQGIPAERLKQCFLLFKLRDTGGDCPDKHIDAVLGRKGFRHVGRAVDAQADIPGQIKMKDARNWMDVWSSPCRVIKNGF